jgi:glycosyltransferase involved in cell wall biosynthesis
VKKILILTAHRPGRSPGQRFRFEQYLTFLEQNGIQTEMSYILNHKDDEVFYSPRKYLRKLGILLKSIRIRLNDMKRVGEFDAVFIFREAVMFGSAYFEKRISRTGVPIIFDFDDAIWLMDVSEANRRLRWLKRPSKTADILKTSRIAFAGNAYLADYARNYCVNVHIIPTTLDTRSFKPVTAARPDDRICIGWTGSYTTLKHFLLAMPVLEKLNRKYPGKLRFRLISDRAPENTAVPVEFIKWSAQSETLDLCGIDIGIMPLPDDQWAKGKCGFKGLQYMALGIPAVMSPVGVNTEIVTHGVNGFLPATDEEWIDKLSLLIESPELRREMGANGMRSVEERYSFNAVAPAYLSLIRSVIRE